MRGVIDPAEAGLSLGRKYGGRVSVRVSVGQAASEPTAATVKMRINNGNRTGFSISRPQSWEDIVNGYEP